MPAAKYCRRAIAMISRSGIWSINPAPKIAGAWLGFGHHHVGLTGGPKTGRLLAQLISGARPNIDLAPYAPARFD